MKEILSLLGGNWVRENETPEIRELARQWESRELWPEKAPDSFLPDGHKPDKISLGEESRSDPVLQRDLLEILQFWRTENLYSQALPLSDPEFRAFQKDCLSEIRSGINQAIPHAVHAAYSQNSGELSGFQQNLVQNLVQELRRNWQTYQKIWPKGREPAEPAEGFQDPESSKKARALAEMAYLGWFEMQARRRIEERTEQMLGAMQKIQKILVQKYQKETT